jgi:hypothetical protein
MLTSEDSPSSLGDEEVIITKLSISPKPTQKRLLMRFTQKRAISTKPSNTHPPFDHFHAMPTQPCVIFIKGDHE